ncbi:glycosyltransferase family 4 protein [Bradyrhizobium quebecense]|uniref:Glycosyltransferase family 4 protein n=2 Tax=Bradyrhizobium quebecense TaxID=2748629 RepID=A0ABS3MCB7_9BRAD|nr:glycosyltransferase family 4 protein [Bradyrhizobium quebecense]UGY04446.1 glycosyltransferase family 4 protein [Bradyrhizobium quebecense]
MTSVDTSGAITHVPPPQGLDWHRRFQEQHGRALRVLHLGNIANNAFNNARIQRQHGIDAYVIAYENYHIMASPEWEEATFEGDLGDPFFPDWTRVDLGGYQRPGWFASGPLNLCCSMIAAEVGGQPDLAEEFRRSLDRARQSVCSQRVSARVIRLGQKIRRRIRRSPAMARDIFMRRVLARDDPEQKRLVDVWRQGRAPGSPPSAADFGSYRARLAPLMGLLDRFDIIQAYATDGAWPLLARRPYFGYEHGTLRAIPFQDDGLGRLTATVFLGADHVFVTNIDCVPAARRLGVPPDRITPLPHAFDDTKLVEFGARNGTIRPPDDQVVVFHPTRQDWRDADPSLVKGNDRLIRAFARVAQQAPVLRLAMIAWGRDLDASRELIRSLGLDDKVQWLAPMRKPELWKTYLRSHAVLDQFVLPSFGGITFEALALGRRVITNVDAGTAKEFFSEAPPILSASTESEIAEALRKIVADRDDRHGLGAAGAAWIQKYHSAARIVELQLAAYRRHIESVRA